MYSSEKETCHSGKQEIFFFNLKTSTLRYIDKLPTFKIYLVNIDHQPKIHNLPILVVP